uniref:Secreted protein n=1 Tax=Rhipicephalus appendiculatus TaxID=34631 RepID=A0A131YBH9_RHIAP
MAQAVPAWSPCVRLLLGLVDLHVAAVVPCYRERHAIHPPYTPLPPYRTPLLCKLRILAKGRCWRRSISNACLFSLLKTAPRVSEEACVNEVRILSVRLYPPV